MVLIDGTNYVRSIQKANPDGSLTFFCAIEEGLVLRGARGVDLVGNLEEAFAGIQAAIGQPQLVVGCDCILRKLEMTERGLVDRVEEVFRDNNVALVSAAMASSTSACMSTRLSPASPSARSRR